ncbi:MULTISPECIES: efflux RND transporter permease subunit [Thiomicrorhabdus]|uniref:Efflux pump membrane transporter n=1 Tax=Thiomicrorhabdus heinhorstiae TaxID=2748010 RepID=A0ABS0BVD7_9GAMM|nr:MULTISPECIES: multidrug efflux RND transporter permease subunit [Thiomicrorhabdus]MBF6057745.1 multidrug efflux RND transporter permease subunit [Thiomicrorhabdus heinhorstiae]
MFSRFFIDRPVFASVFSIIIVIAGYLAMKALPVAEYPQIVPPQVQVTATYPGASAETLSETVAAPLEQAINGIDDMLYINSVNSSSGVVTLTVTFKIGTDIDQANINVNNKVQGALNKLPSEVQQLGVQVNKRSPSILKVIALYSGDSSLDTVFIANYGLINVVDDLARLPGVGEVRQFGSKDYSMRIWLNPEKLKRFSLTPADVYASIKQQNSQFAAGSFGAEPIKNGEPFTYTVSTAGRMNNPEEFENIILRTQENGGILRLKDVARVELGSQAYNFNATFDGKPTVPMGIFLQPGANALETAKLVDAKMAELAKNFPQGLNYATPYDTSEFVRISIDKVIYTLVEALILVVLVVFLFLQNFRATLIPVLAIPVSIVGTFIGMYLLGFSINQLTLFGMILAIGIVVDDAIIVVENVERIMRSHHLSAREATLEAMREITGPIIAIVLVLAAVFIPVAFISGLSGEMYKQFAITIVVSVTISGIVALTLTPALCANLLKEGHLKPSPVFGLFNRGFDAVTRGFGFGVRQVMRFSLISILIFGGLIYLTYNTLNGIPKSLVPQEDKGTLFVLTYLPPASSLERTEIARDQVSQTLLNQPGVAHSVSFAGFDLQSFALKTDSAVSFVTLDHWDEREAPNMSSQAIVGQLFGKLMAVPDAFSIPIGMPTIMGMSMTGGFEAYIQDRQGTGSLALSKIADELVAKANARPELTQVRTTLSTKVPQYQIVVDRDKAQLLQVSAQEIFAAMQSTFGSLYVNDFTLFGRTFKVNLQADGEFRASEKNLDDVFVRSANGDMIPLSALVSVKRTTGADIIDRFNLFQAAKISGDPAPGYSSGQALTAFEEVAKEVMPEGYTLGWVGEAFQQKQSSDTGNQAFLFGLLFVFLILAAQYERWSIPLVVLTAVPFAVLGAAVAVTLAGQNNDIYFELGLLTLIGLSAKNAILIVEFAMQKHKAGMPISEAAQEAVKLRFRPIVMTSLAFTIAAVPLMLSTGAGAAARVSVGTGLVGGMIAATILAPLFVPMFFKLIAGLSERGKGKQEAKPTDQTHQPL